jgi:hypothetical protein
MKKAFGRAIFCVIFSGNMIAQTPSPQPDINAVLAAHDRELLALKNVTGVYVGVLEGSNRPCLTVMLKEPSPETERALPRELEGFPVVVKVSGEIRPLTRP